MRRQITALAGCFILGFLPPVWAAPANVPPEWQEPYEQGVEAYRDGEYEKSLKIFKNVTQQVPQSLEAQYYYAISLAQLGRFKEARQAYQSIIDRAPESEAARLAQQGIAYLPSPNTLDAPPRFQKPKNEPDANTQTAQEQKTASPFGNIDSETMQMMLMMSAFGGAGGGGGGFNPMMLPLLQQLEQGNSKGGKPKIPPEMFSSMMIQQMMSDSPLFDTGGGGDR